MILLDTHVWVRWLDASANPLPADLLDRIELADQLAVSAISCWVVALLTRRGRMTLKAPIAEWLDWGLRESDVQCLSVNGQIATKAAQLPEHHRDPADRIIIATALEYRSMLISLDSKFQEYEELANQLLPS